MPNQLVNEPIMSRVATAVAQYWESRSLQHQKQISQGLPDQGARSAVTGGAQMDGFISLFREAVLDTGIGDQFVFTKKAIELPGYFRPTKEWDLLVVKNGLLIAAIEAKSQVGPSFGNNFNNRTEEAMGSALDLWTAFRKGAFHPSPPPFLGYFFLLEDCPASHRGVGVREPHFPVFPEFLNASYAKRYELFCRRLVLERHYSAASFMVSDAESGIAGAYDEPAADLQIITFLKRLAAQVTTYV